MEWRMLQRRCSVAVDSLEGAEVDAAGGRKQARLRNGWSKIGTTERPDRRTHGGLRDPRLDREASCGRMMIESPEKLFAQVRGLVGGGPIKSSQSQLTSRSVV